MNLFCQCMLLLLKSTSCHDRFLSVSTIACALTNCVNNQLVWFVMCLFAVSVQWDWRDREETLVDFVSISWISLKNFYQTFCHICTSSRCIICIPVCNRVSSEYTGLFDHFHYIHYSSFIIYGRACQCVVFRLRRFVEISFMSSTFGESSHKQISVKAQTGTCDFQQFSQCRHRLSQWHSRKSHHLLCSPLLILPH